MNRKYSMFMCILVMHFFGNQMHAMDQFKVPVTAASNTSFDAAGFSARSKEKFTIFSNALLYVYHFHNLIDDLFVPLVKDVEGQARAQSLTESTMQDAMTLLNLRQKGLQGSSYLGEKIMNIARQYAQAKVTLDVFDASDQTETDTIVIAHGQPLNTFMADPSALHSEFATTFIYQWLKKISSWAFVNNPSFRGKKIFYPGLLLFLLGMIQHIEDIDVQIHQANIGFSRSQQKILEDALTDVFAKTITFYKEAFARYEHGEANEGWWKYVRYAKNIASVPSFGQLPQWKGFPRVPDLVNELRPGVALQQHFSASPVNYIRNTALREHSFYQKWLQRIFSKKGLAIAGAAGVGVGAYMLGRKYAPSQLGQAAKDVAIETIGAIPRGVKGAYNWAQKVAISPDELEALQDSAARARELEIELKQQEIAAQKKALEEEQRREYKEQQSDFKPPSQELPTEKEGPSGSVKDLWENRPTWLGGSGSGPQEDKTSGVLKRLKLLSPWGKQE